MYGSNKSKVWALVNEITNYKRKTKTNIKSLKDGEGNKLTNSISIVNYLNTHFATVGKTMAQKIDAIGSDRLKDPRKLF